MTRDELIERLKGYEWYDVEFKKARRGVPNDAYTTVSAFANTAGGWLVFGVKKGKNKLEVIGVEDVDKVQNDFLSCLRAGDKLGRTIDTEGKLYDIDDKAVLAFHIPELPRSEKPLSLKGHPGHSYIRRGGGDERCTQKELERFLRDAASEQFEKEPLPDLDPETFFDERAVAWYRRSFNDREPGRHETLNDVEFLQEWGFLVEIEGKLTVTRAAVLLFGKGRHVRRWLPRPVVDFQIIHERFENWSVDRRWADRIVAEDNIIQAWLAVVERYMKYADRPFDINAVTLRRHDEPPDYISFREAAINLLIHQDYGDTGRHAQIQIFRDQARFWNPGDAFGTLDQLLEPGAKEVRNPALVGAFRRIGLSDQAGTGIRAIFRNWRKLGNVPPKIVNQRAEKAFELTLLKEPLLSENQKRFQEELGTHLSGIEADTFALACREKKISLTDVRAIGGMSTQDALSVLKRLVVQKLIEPIENERIFQLSPHLHPHYDRMLTSEGPESGLESRPESGLESDVGLRILSVLEKVPLSRSEIAKGLGHKKISGAVNRTISRLLADKSITYTIPEKPQSRLQKYRITKKGQTALSRIQGNNR